MSKVETKSLQEYNMVVWILLTRGARWN